MSVGFAAIVLALLLQSATPAAQEFRIVATFGCPAIRIDTAAGTSEADTSGTATIVLSRAERAQLAAAVERAQFFALPTEVRDQANADGTVTVSSGGNPDGTRVEVHVNGKVHAVRYDPSRRGTPSAEVDRFISVFRAVVDMFQQRSEVKNLPPPTFFCL